MTGWWESDEKFKDCLMNGLFYCIFGYIEKCGFTDRTNSSKVVAAIKKHFELSSLGYFEDYGKVIKKMRDDCHEAYNRWLIDSESNTSGMAFYSISAEMFWSFQNKDNTENDRALLMAFLSLKSLLGNREYMLTNQLALTTRMSCRTKLKVELTDIPSEVRKYISRRRRERMMNELCYIYKVAVYSFYGSHGFYVSLKRDEQGEPDMKWLVDKVKSERTISDRAKNYRKELLRRCMEKNKAKQEKAKTRSNENCINVKEGEIPF